MLNRSQAIPLGTAVAGGDKMRTPQSEYHRPLWGWWSKSRTFPTRVGKAWDACAKKKERLGVAGVPVTGLFFFFFFKWLLMVVGFLDFSELDEVCLWCPELYSLSALLSLLDFLLFSPAAVWSWREVSRKEEKRAAVCLTAKTKRFHQAAGLVCLETVTSGLFVPIFGVENND